MNRQLTVVLVAVVGIVAVAGGAVLFTGENGGTGASPAANDAAAAVEQSTPISQPSESTEQPTETDDTTSGSDDAPDDTPTPDGAQSVERANEPPTADAGEDATVREWTLTTLDASGSADPDGDDANLTYEWSQVAGDTVELRDSDSPTTAFFAPESKLKTELTFEVTVTDEDGATATDTVTISVSESRDDHSETENASDTGNKTVGNETDGNQTAGNESDAGDDPDSDGDGVSDDDGSDADDGDTAGASNDTIAQAKFGSDFDDLNAEDAATVYELSLRQPGDDDWDPSSVETRDELAQEAYGADFDELGFDARVDVQETFDAQFGDTGGELSKDVISRTKWDHDFQNLSDDSAGQITEMYDRQPWINQNNDHVPTREQLAYRIYDADSLDELTREERLDVEYRYNAQFTN